MQKGKRRLLCSLRGREKGDATRLPARISSTTRCVVRRLAAAGAAGVWGSKNRALRSHRCPIAPLPTTDHLPSAAPPSRTRPSQPHLSRLPSSCVSLLAVRHGRSPAAAAHRPALREWSPRSRAPWCTARWPRCPAPSTAARR